MNILVFKTNIQTRRMADCLAPLFIEHPIITDWSVDIEDIDNVLRIETIGNTSESEIIHMINDLGIACEALQD